MSLTSTTKVAASASQNVTKRAGGGGITMILSPAKTLDLSKLSPAHESFLQASCNGDGSSVPSCDDEKTTELGNILKSKSQKQLKDLLKVSDKIASSVKDYYNSFVTDVNSNTNNIHSNTNPKLHAANVKPAIFTFHGPAFKGISIDPSTCDTSTMAYLQANLRIIDPLYGSLRPLDLIQPYRLEMATKNILKDLKHTKGSEWKSLAEWWRGSITSSILGDMRCSGSGVLINLASDEYASAVDVEQITSSSLSSSSTLSNSKMKFIKVVFQQEGRVIAVHAKRARGLMVRYIADHQLEDIEGIKNFDLEGYTYCNDKSQLWGDDGSGNEGEDDDDDGCGVMVFDRKKNWKEEEEENEGKAKKEAGKDSMHVQKKRKATKDKKVGKRTRSR